MNAQDKWLQDIENSLQGLKPAESNPYLFSKIMNRIASTRMENTVSPKALWLTAASLIALVLINLAVITVMHSKESNQKPGLESFSMQLGLMNTNSVNYN